MVRSTVDHYDTQKAKRSQLGECFRKSIENIVIPQLRIHKLDDGNMRNFIRLHYAVLLGTLDEPWGFPDGRDSVLQSIGGPCLHRVALPPKGLEVCLCIPLRG